MKIITPNTNIGPGSVQNSFIADGAVTADKIADGAITSAKIGVDVIVAEDIANNAITVAELSNNAVTTAKILDANVTEAKIADDAVSLAKIKTTGASNGQVLAYNSTSGAVEWTNDTDIDVGNITDKTKISNSASLVSPILHLETDNTGTDKTHILLEDSVDDAVSIVGRTNTGWYRYQSLLTLDPNHTKPRTNVGGTGVTSAGDYAFDFIKNYGSNEDTISMDMSVWGANDGFNIIARDDENGGVDSYNYKPIRLKGSDVSVRIGTTPFGSTVEKLAFNDYGTAVSNGALVHGLDRNTSNHHFTYTGTDTAGTPGVPSMQWHMHRRDSQNRTMEIMEATDYGSGDAAVVETGKQLTVNPVKVSSAVPIKVTAPTVGLTTPALHLETGQSGWNKAHLLLEDSNDDVVAVVGRNDTTLKNYQYNFTLDPNNTKPRTNVGGTGVVYPGDYFVAFEKNYYDQDEIEMTLKVYGAHNGFIIEAHDDSNGTNWSDGLAYNWKPIVLKGSEVSVKTNTGGQTPIERVKVDNTRVTINNLTRLHNAGSDPSNPLQGDVYYNTISDRIKLYTGAGWKTLSVD